MLVYLAESSAAGILWKAFDYGIEMAATGGDPDVSPADEWRKFVFVGSNTASSETADDQLFSFDIVNHTNGTVDNSWTDADHNTCIDQLESAVTALMSGVSSYIHVTQCKAYARAYNPLANQKPFADSGPPVFVRDMLHTGGATSTAAPQVCSTLTEMTPSRRHWGRTFSPTIGASALTATGRLADAFMEGVINALQQSYEALQAADYHPVVPTTWSGKSGTPGTPNYSPGTPTRTLQFVTGVRIDDVPDVHRSRRWRHSITMKERPVPTATLLPANVGEELDADEAA